jgi:hypothetical protein
MLTKSRVPVVVSDGRCQHVQGILDICGQRFQAALDFAETLFDIEDQPLKLLVNVV